MKRSLALLAMVVAAIAAGCGGSSNKSSQGGGSTNASGKGLRVGLVTDVGGLNDRGFNHLAYLGVQEAAAKLGAAYHVNLSASSGEYVPNLAAFARQNYNLIIGVGYTEANAIDTAANQFPKNKFAIVDVDQTTEPHKPPNLLGLLFREQEVGYLAGYLAGLEEKRRPGPDVIGSVGGQKQPPVDRFIAGYQAGAKAADPGIRTLNGYSQDFVKQDLCKTIALNQIAEGAGVVFQVAGGCGLGVIKAAADKNVWAIGVDADQSYIDPKHVLTSATKHVDVAVFKAIQSVKNGTFKGGNVTYGLKDNGVGLGKINPRVPKSEIAKVDKIRQEIVSGKIKNIPTTVK
ncbi:MAG TPA: BMP family ABC transporter substrate-binding protein [Gaiellaceae bacterium]|nr:BMP family ABC transporter substrate-binding protein [Gaiellaceae bacterium]